MATRKPKDELYTREEIETWNEAMDTVIELMRIHPPSRIGEASFMRKLTLLRKQAENDKRMV